MEYTQITLDQWTQWKEDIRRKLAETANNFVYIGYRLKQIRDSQMLDGCADIFEFAQKEYGLGESTVSRFIAINEKFSENGNSLTLKMEYQGLSSSKLSEMLTLSDEECKLITTKTTVKEIRELKSFSRQQVPDDIEQPQGYTPLQKCIIDYFSDKKREKMLNDVIDTLYRGGKENYKAAAELMNPGEYTTHKKGIVFLFLYDYQTGVKYKMMSYPSPVSMEWKDFLDMVRGIYIETYYGLQNPENLWKEFYKNEEVEKAVQLSENQAVATSQQEGEKEENEEEKTETEMEENEPESEEFEPETEDSETENEENKPEIEESGDCTDGNPEHTERDAGGSGEAENNGQEEAVEDAHTGEQDAKDNIDQLLKEAYEITDRLSDMFDVPLEKPEEDELQCGKEAAERLLEIFAELIGGED